jgi:hypothetical protein
VFSILLQILHLPPSRECSSFLRATTGVARIVRNKFLGTQAKGEEEANVPAMKKLKQDHDVRIKTEPSFRVKTEPHTIRLEPNAMKTETDPASLSPPSPEPWWAKYVVPHLTQHRERGVGQAPVRQSVMETGVVLIDDDDDDDADGDARGDKDDDALD